MTQVKEARVCGLYRYPVKGLSAEPLPEVELTPGRTFPLDRAWALEAGEPRFDAAAPAYLPKTNFVVLMRYPQIALLDVRLDQAARALSISNGGASVVRGDLETEAGRAAIEAAVTEAVGPQLKSSPRIVHAPGHSFSDVAAKCVHVINLASVRALEAELGMRIDPVRFRANLVVDGLAAWSELELIGARLEAGRVSLEIFKATQRCLAIDANPQSGVRDTDLASVLKRLIGKADFGVYARITSGGRLAVGDVLTIRA